MFNWVDLLIILFLGFFTLEAIGRSFILEALDFFSFVFAFFLSFSLYNLPGKLFEIQFKIPHGLSLVFGFMTIWFLSEIIFYLIVRLLIPRLSIFKTNSINLLSVVPAFLRGLVFIAFLLVMTATFPIQPTIKKGVLESNLGSRILKSAFDLEQPVKNVFGGLANDSLTFLTIRPQTDEKVDLGFQTSLVSVDTISESAMLELVNKERVSRGLNALTFDPKLRDVARLHSEDMLKRGYFSHYSPEGQTVADRALGQDIDFLVIGENLAYAPSIELAHRGLMNSPGHKANILSEDYTKIGIGVMDGGVYGKMFVQVFSN